MQLSASGYNGCVSAPHAPAAKAALAILEAGGTAIEAMVAAASTIAVSYPHMNGIGGDCFWLVKQKGRSPVSVFGGGPSANLATAEWFASRGHTQIIPPRGPLAALTVPGAVDGWRKALELVDDRKRMPLKELLASAIDLARNGTAITDSQHRYTCAKLAELENVPGFSNTFLHQGNPPAEGDRLYQRTLADTLQFIADQGLRAFYDGDIASENARFLEAQGSPLRLEDFRQFHATFVEPLICRTPSGSLYNLAPPTQGLASLIILALFGRLDIAESDSFAHVHGLVEATKQAFIVRNATIGDPDFLAENSTNYLCDQQLDALATKIDSQTALPWPYAGQEGDTVWMGAIDHEGTVVSFIQSIYWEFGSGLVCPSTGVIFQNRGASFSLTGGPNQLAPRKRPFHTLNPAMAILNDDRILAYGTMGGEGQPQTQAAIFTRYACFDQSLEQAISAPRWLLGRTWGDTTTSLKLERSLSAGLIDDLKAAGHQIEIIADKSDLVGHAGAVSVSPNGLMVAACDPRSNGLATAF